MAGNGTAEWRPVDGGIADFQNEARKRDLFTDIQFVIGTGESSKTFGAHKAVLACGSPVFERMFYGEAPDSNSVINIEEDDPEAFEMLLTFLYGKGRVLQISSFIRALKFFIIGVKYSVPGIQTIVTDFIISTTMSEDSFWKIIEKDVFACEILVEKIMSFMQPYACNLMESDKFIHMPEPLIEIILQMDAINITEIELLTSVTRWAYSFFGSDANSGDLRKYFRHIRFSALTADAFSKFISVFPNAIDAQSSLEILKHLNDKFTYQLPMWCATSTVSRNDEVQMLSTSPSNSEGFNRISPSTSAGRNSISPSTSAARNSISPSTSAGRNIISPSNSTGRNSIAPSNSARGQQPMTNIGQAINMPRGMQNTTPRHRSSPYFRPRR